MYMKKSYLMTIVSMLVILSIVPVSATDVLDIEVTEYISVADTYNGTMANGPVSGTGQINITNTLSSTTLYDISINFNSGTTSPATWSTTSTGTNVTVQDSDVIVHINYLDASSSVLVNYSLSSASRPIIFSESYTSNMIMVNDSTNATLTLTRNTTADITGITLIKTAANINSNGAYDFNFSNDDPDLGSSVITNNNATIMWTIAELNSSNPNATLNFTISESDPDAHNSSTPQSSQEFDVGNASLAFTISNTTISGSGITLNENPTATTLGFRINLQKNQLGTSENGTGGDDWGFTPEILNVDAENINYTISLVTVYVTNDTNLNLSTAFDSQTYTPGEISNSVNNPWSASEWKIYDFPDPVPVGWIDVDLSANLTDAGGQISKLYLTTNDSYVLQEKIFVINGYLIEVRKTITKNATDDYYDISLWIHNKGNLKTPPTVIVYDIIPTNFTSVWWGTAPDGSQAVVTPIQGMAYWWNVSTLEVDGIPGNQTYINYTINGVGIYHMTDLFIVGIDPTYSLALQSTPLLSISNKLVMGANIEPLLCIITICVLLFGYMCKRKNGKGS